jgi:signal peptidase I
MAKSDRKSQQPEKKTGFREYAESFVVALAIALVIRALFIYPFRIPTGSMEDTLLVGDFLIANKFVYGIRTPDWIGIPYTQIGFKIPFFRTPGFREPVQGDVVIFKYPKDETLNYIKRCIAVSGDTVEVRNKVVTVNGKVFPNPPHSKFIYPTYPEQYKEYAVFPPGAGNRDFFGPVRVPAPGDTFGFSPTNVGKWFERFQLMLYEGRKLTVSQGNETIRLTVKNQNRWDSAFHMVPIDRFFVDGKPLAQTVYTVKNRHLFLMGDNRDNSLDSRYWGFLPERFVVGEALIIYWSWDGNLPLYQLFDKIRFGRILNLIH